MVDRLQRRMQHLFLRLVSYCHGAGIADNLAKAGTTADQSVSVENTAGKTVSMKATVSGSASHPQVEVVDELIYQ